MSNLLNIATLIKAAEYIERRDREAEHGYASTLPMPVHNTPYRRRTKICKLPTKVRVGRDLHRSSHNELEKTRRANLRHCLECLKSVVPLKPDATRHTTLGLLVDARMLITKLEEREKALVAARVDLDRKQRYLRSLVTQLSDSDDVQPRQWYRCRVSHTISESSASTSTSLTSSEQDDIDRVSSTGYGSDSNEAESASEQNQLVVAFSDSLSHQYWM